MTLSQFLFETGPAGANMTNGNSGSSASSVGGGSTVFTTAAAAHGTFGGEFTNVAASQTYRRWPFAAVTKTGQVSVVLEYINPGETVDLVGLVNSGGVRRATVRVMSTGIIRLTAGSGNYDLVPAGTITVGTKFRVAFEFVGGSTTASTLQGRAYTASTPGVYDNAIGSAVSTTTADLSVDDLVGVELGILSNTASARTMRADDLQINDGAGSRIVDYAAPLGTPVVTVAAQVNPTTIGGTNGTVQVTWPAISGATAYDAYVATGGTPAQGDFTLVASSVTSPYTFTGLSAGIRAYGIRARSA